MTGPRRRRASMPSLTELPAHFAAAGRSESGENRQQRKLSSRARARFCSNRPSPAQGPPTKENPHEAAFGLFEDARPRRRRHRRGANPPRTRPQRRRHDLPRRGGQPTPVHLAHHPDLVLPLQKPRHHRHDQPRRARTRARPARSRPRNSSKPSTPPGPTSTTSAPTSAPSIASASRRACCNPTASPRPPSTASFASTTCSLPTTTTTRNASPSA